MLNLLLQVLMCAFACFKGGSLDFKTRKLRSIKSKCLTLYHTVGLLHTLKQNPPSVSPLSTLCI